jgi:hypothetical protein
MRKEEMDWKRVFFAGIGGTIVNIIYSMTICTQIIVPWLKEVTGPELWVEETGLFLPTMIAFGTIICFLWAFGYALLYKGIPGAGIAKGVIYGILVMWILGVLPHMAALYLHTTISPEIIWIFITANALLRAIILGVTYAITYKE